MKTSEKAFAGIGGVILAVAATFSGIAIANPAAPTDGDSPAMIVNEEPSVIGFGSEVEPEPTEEPVEPAPAPEPAPEPAPVAPAPPPPPAPPAPVKCPAGSHPNAVDAAGNESACQPLGPQGKQCVAYNDQNECTAYLES